MVPTIRSWRPGRRVHGSLSRCWPATGSIRPTPVHALRMLRSLFHGFSTIEAAGGFQMDTDIDDSFEWLIGFIDRGLRNR